jgi:hypothetical protein
MDVVSLLLPLCNVGFLCRMDVAPTFTVLVAHDRIHRFALLLSAGSYIYIYLAQPTACDLTHQNALFMSILGSLFGEFLNFFFSS